MERNNAKHRTLVAQMSLDEILNLTEDVLSYYTDDERLRLFANISMYFEVLTLRIRSAV